MKVEIYKVKDGVRWRVRDKDQSIMAESRREPYTSVDDAFAAWGRFMLAVTSAANGSADIDMSTTRL